MCEQRRLLLALVIILMTACCWSQSPTYYDFYPRSIMYLGGGFSVADLTEPKQPCVIFKPKPLDLGSLETRATDYKVQTGMCRPFQSDARLTVRYEFKGAEQRFAVQSKAYLQATN